MDHNYPASHYDPSQSINPFATRYRLGVLDMSEVLMASTLLKVLESHHNKPFDIWVLLERKNLDGNACTCKLSLFTAFEIYISRYSFVRQPAWVCFSFLDLSIKWNISHNKRKQAIKVARNWYHRLFNINPAEETKAKAHVFRQREMS